MRPRVDAHVASVVMARASVIAEAVLAATPSLRARKEWQRHAYDAEFAGHARALAAAVDLRCPAVFQAHARLASRLHDAAGLPQESVGACFRALLEQVGNLELPAESRRWMIASLEAGAAVSGGPADVEQVDLWDATTAALRGDRAAYLSAVEAWREERGVRVALLGIAEVQRQVGDAWVRHQATILEEHRASALAAMGLALLAPETWGAPGPRRRGQAVLAAAPGEHHATGLLIAAHLLEVEGYAVEVLGGDTPGVQLAVACVERKPALVGVAVSAIDHLPAAREAIEMVRHAAPHSCIVAGGAAARAAGAPALGADVLVPEHFDGRLPTHAEESSSEQADAVR
ncbi:MAG: cobalamin-dependent protein [Deltaproteobacteria bacterium]